MKPSARAAAGRGTRRRYSFLDLLRLSVVRALIERGLAAPELEGADLRPLYIERVHTLVMEGHFPQAIAEANAALDTALRKDRLASELLIQLARPTCPR